MSIPDDILDLIHDADEVRRRYQWERSAQDTFVASDPASAYEAIAALDDRCGMFLEWGSGLGTITLIAARLGFDAYGIEVNERLADAARELAERHGVEATFATGSFLPAGSMAGLDPPTDLYHDAAADDGYDELGLSLSDFDLVYVYPWAQEVGFFRRLFLSGAQVGARLLLNLGDDGFSLVRR